MTSLIFIYYTYTKQKHLGCKKCKANQKSNIANRHVLKGGQVTKPIILVKICYKLLYVIQGVENSFDKVTSWPQLISEFWSHMPVCNVALLIGLALFYTPGVFG